MGLVPEPVRLAREVLRQADVVQRALFAHYDPVNREVTGGRRMTIDESISAGMTDPETLASAATGKPIPRPAEVVAKARDNGTPSWQVRKQIADQAAARAASDPPLQVHVGDAAGAFDR